MDAGSMERLVPDLLAPGDATGQETLQFHLARYEFAATHLRPGRVLDIACGVGYGASLLAERRSDVTLTAVDISEDAIAYAKDTYTHDRITFEVGDATTFRDPSGGFDSIVSLETIEHLPAPDKFVGHLVTLLNPGGVFVASVPTTPSMDANPHHLHDFTERSFRAILSRCGLREIAALPQIQPYRVLPLLRRTELRAARMRQGLLGYYLRHPGAAARRAYALFRFGFTNRYLTVAVTKPQQD